MSDKLSDDERARLDAEVKRDYQMGAAWPFDAPDAWWDGSKRAELTAVDSAHAAARAIIRDLSDRGGIKRGFENIGEETRVEIVTKLAAIIRAASPAPDTPAVPMSDQQILDIAKRVTPAFRESPASCIALVREALKAALAIPESEWQPIETVPKDGTEVALLFADEVTVLGKRRPRVRAASWLGDWTIPYHRDNPPIGWMHMPAAPGGAARDGGGS